jgi:anti-anti-sigma factor
LRATDGGSTLVISGEVDIATAELLNDELQSEVLATDGDVRIDSSGLDFIDSSGMLALVRAHRQLEPDGRRLVLHDPSDFVRRVIEINGLTNILVIE